MQGGLWALSCSGQSSIDVRLRGHGRICCSGPWWMVARRHVDAPLAIKPIAMRREENLK
jgi:hypothetical protein